MAFFGNKISGITAHTGLLTSIKKTNRKHMDRTTDRNLFSDRPSHGKIRTLDQDYHLKVDEWTDLFTMDHPPHGRIRRLDPEYHFEVGEFHQMNGGGRADEWMDKRSTNYIQLTVWV